MSFLIHAYKGYAREWDFVLYESDGTTELSLAADDVVRVKIGTNGAAPTLDLSSIDPAEVTFTAGTGDCCLMLTEEQFDDLVAGAYDVSVLVFDESEDKLKHAEYGVFHVHPAMLGETGGEVSSSSGGSSASSESSSSSS